MLYAIGKEDRRIHYTCPNKQNLDIMLANANDNISNYIILQEDIQHENIHEDPCDRLDALHDAHRCCFCSS